MNKVLYLEPDEEIISVVDRLKGAKDKKIALVIPAGAIILSSAINLRLLFEESQKIGKNISIVTTDSTGGNIASKVGFTVYETLGDAREMKARDIEEQEREAPILKRKVRNLSLEKLESDHDDDLSSEEVPAYTDIDDEENPPKADRREDFFEQKVEEDPNYLGRQETKKIDTRHDFYAKGIKSGSKIKLFLNPKIIASGIGIFLLALFLMVFVFPKATVYLNVYSNEEEVSVGFKVSADKVSPEIVSGVTTLPGKFETVEKEVAVTADATGQKNVGNKAKGQANVYNRSGKPVTISKGIEFLTSDNKRYILMDNVTVGGAQVSDYGQMLPGVAIANLEASEGGVAYNIKTAKFYIPGLADTVGNLVYAQSDNGFDGGDDKQAKVASKEDIEGVKKKAKEEAGKQIQGELGMKGERVFVQGLSKTETVSENIDKKEGEEAEKINDTVKLKFTFLTFSKADFDKMFDEAVKLRVSDQKQLVGSGYRDVKWEVMKYDEKKKEGEVNGKAIILNSTRINEEFLKSKIITLNVQDLRTVLGQYPEVELDHVSFFPPLILSSIPSNERNIKIVIKYVEKSE